MNTRNCVLIAVSAAIMTACASGKNTSVRGNAKIETPTIELKVDVPTNKLEVFKGPSTCPSNQKGCIDTGLDDIAFVSFSLTGSGGYGLTQMWICATTSKPDPDNPNCSLTADQQSEFIAIVNGQPKSPNSQGIIALENVDDYFLLNQNSFEEDYFYLIEACKSATDCARMDPRMRNGGRTITR